MKYILNFDNNKLKELNLKGMREFKRAKEEVKGKEIKKSQQPIKKVLDTDDLLILKFINAIGTERKTVRCKEDKEYFWLKLSALLEEYEGLLFMTKTALNVRLNKYVEMKLIERKCVKNESGSFSFFKITGLKELLYVPIDSMNRKPVKNQMHFSEFIEEDVQVDKEKIQVKEKNIEERLIDETGESKERVKQAISYAEGKKAKDIFAYSRDTIKNGWDSKKVSSASYSYSQKENIGTGFNNFKAREYDYDSLEKKLLGWE